MQCSVWLAWLGCVACGSTGYGDPPGGSGSQITFSWAAQRVSPDTITAVVDDTPLAAPLRDQFAVAFDGLDAAITAHEASCRPPYDPAAWHPVDRSVLIVHPSANAGARFSSPAADPALRWRENNQSGEGRTRWLAAVRGALAAQPAAVDAPFQALAAFHDTVTLLRGTRQPATAEEQALLSALPGGPNLVDFASLVVATEDQSPGEASQYTDETPLPLIVPAATPDPTRSCSRPTEAATPRYQGWSLFPQLWPCTDPDFFDLAFADCSTRCLTKPIATLASGAAVCLASASYAGIDPCPADRGWLDPIGSNGVRAPRVEHSAAGDTRVCEVRQLDGPALASCRTEAIARTASPAGARPKCPSSCPRRTACLALRTRHFASCSAQAQVPTPRQPR